MSRIVPIHITTPFPEGSVNAYLLLGNPVTLVDTGLGKEDSMRQIETSLNEAGVDWSDIAQVVVTHMHTDHAGGVPAIQKKVNVPIYVHANARYTITGGQAEFERIENYFQGFFRMCGAEGKVVRGHKFREVHFADVRYVDDGDTIMAGGREYQVLYVPGHSQTDICLYHAQSQDAIVGDHLLKEISANAFMEPPMPLNTQRPKALVQYRASMERTKHLSFGTVYPGHGSPYVGHTQLIEQRFREHDERCETIVRHLADGKRTVYELSQAMFPWLKGNAVFLGLSEILGHIDLLVLQNQVVAKEEKEVLYFRPT